MRARFITAVLATIVTLTFAGYSGAQDSTAPAAASSLTTSTKSPAKNSTGKLRSLADKDAALPSERAKKPKSERATFAAGCFWHVEAEFERLRGVNWAVSGYSGGNFPDPTYEMVHEGFTGHAECVMVEYDPGIVSYEKLLKVFWSCHDPTTLNRQGPDVGTQYRSVIFYHSEGQRKAALESYRELTDAGVYRSPIVTQLVPMKAFYRAEDYHQDYYGGKPRTASRRKASTAKVKKSRSKATSSKAALAPAEGESPEAAPSAQP
jgi:peptide-methionine (S)-S-oxide reductase